MSPRLFVDSNVLLDIITHDPAWEAWSTEALRSALEEGPVVINPIVYAEVAFGFESIEVVNEILPEIDFEYRPIPRAAAFLAARCHADYRAAGGQRAMILPDFLIGAHAVVERLSLLTRDMRRYRSYFPGLTLVSPSS